MPRFFDALVVLAEARPARHLVAELRAEFDAQGATFLPGSDVFFNDGHAEPMSVQSEAEAWDAILAGPQLGGTKYAFSGQMVSVFLWGTSGLIDAVTISVVNTRYVSNLSFHAAVDRLIEGVHRSLHALRTIADHEMLSPGSRWSAQVQRVRAGFLDGGHATDLR
jgi:hypothetical protein